MAGDEASERRDDSGGPVASPLHLPEGYGGPARDADLLPWAHADERLAGARNYWVGTVGPDGTPHAVPLWGVWDGERLFFGTDPRTRTARALARNPAVVVHLESGDDVLIVRGVAEAVTDRATLRRMARLGAAKYGTPAPPDGGDELEASAEGDSGAAHGVYAVRPHTAYAWRNLTQDATRWHFTSDQWSVVSDCVNTRSSGLSPTLRTTDH